MVWFLLALGAVCSFLIFWIVKNAEHQGEIKHELKQANESLKETNDAIKKSDAIDAKIINYDDDAIDAALNKSGWLRPSNDNK